MGLSGALIGAGLYFSQPILYVGKAIIRIGQTSQMADSAIEPITVVYERIKSYAFIKAVGIRSKSEKVETLLHPDKDNGLVAKQIKNGGALEVTLSGRSFETVRLALDSLTAEILSIHNELLNNELADKRNQLSKLNTEIASSTQYLNKAVENLSRDKAELAANLIISTEPALEWKKNHILQLQKDLSGPTIRQTMLIGSPEIVNKRMLNSPWQAILLGLVLGLVLNFSWHKFLQNQLKMLFH